MFHFLLFGCCCKLTYLFLLWLVQNGQHHQITPKISLGIHIGKVIFSGNGSKHLFILALICWILWPILISFGYKWLFNKLSRQFNTAEVFINSNGKLYSTQCGLHSTSYWNFQYLSLLYHLHQLFSLHVLS